MGLVAGRRAVNRAGACAALSIDRVLIAPHVRLLIKGPMSQRIFQQSIVIAAAPEAVYPFFATMTNHTVLHPLITAIRELPPRDDSGTRWYQITDRVGSGRLAFSFSYTAAVRA